MENKAEKVTKWDVSKSCFFFLVLFLIFLLNIQNGNDFVGLSTPMIIGKIVGGLCLLFGVALNGASFVYMLLSYFEKHQGLDK